MGRQQLTQELQVYKIKLLESNYRQYPRVIKYMLQMHIMVQKNGPKNILRHAL